MAWRCPHARTAAQLGQSENETGGSGFSSSDRAHAVFAVTPWQVLQKHPDEPVWVCPARDQSRTPEVGVEEEACRAVLVAEGGTLLIVLVAERLCFLQSPTSDVY